MKNQGYGYTGETSKEKWNLSSLQSRTRASGQTTSKQTLACKKQKQKKIGWKWSYTGKHANDFGFENADIWYHNKPETHGKQKSKMC